jgi:hypothetical protein
MAAGIGRMFCSRIWSRTVFPANAPRPQPDPSSEATAQHHLSLDETPKLRALVEGPDGPEILAELQKLLRRESLRAPRYERDLLARVRSSPGSTPEVAVIRDLSRSGARLELGSSAQLDVMQARTVSIEMRLPGMGFVSREATLVRVVEHRQNGVELAFSFVEGMAPDPGFEELMRRLASGPVRVR